MTPLVLLMCACGVVLDLPEDPAAAAGRLMAELAPAESGRVPFTEERSSRLLAEPLVVRGYLERLENGDLAKVVESPAPERLVLGPDYVLVQAEGRERRMSIRQRPALGALRAGLLALIDRKSGDLVEEFAPSVEEGAEGWRLELVPRSENLARRLERMVLTGCGDRAESLAVYFGDGSQQLMRFGQPEPEA